MNTIELQRRMIALGYSVGPMGADGVKGPNTRKALVAYQVSQRLAPSGVLDAATLATFGVKDQSLPWIDEARRNLGLQEIKGPKHAPAIIRMLDKLSAPFRDDETAWCGTFTGWCFSQTLPNEPLPANPWGSINWLKFGRPLDIPFYGCVAVFWRGSPDSWQGHVGFLVGQDADAYHVLGGNQGDAVTIARIATGRLRKGGLRWPKTFDAPARRLPLQTLAGSLSQNEA